MLTLKWYPPGLCIAPRITCMQPSLSHRVNASTSKVRTVRQSSLLLLVAGLVLVFGARRVCAQEEMRAGVNLTVAEQYLLAAANEERANLGLSPLKLNP